MVALHVLSIFITGLAVLYSDEQGLSWMLGKKKVLSAKRVAVLHAIVGVGLALIILTGGLMVIKGLPYYLHKPVFLIKMAFVFALIVNAFVIEHISKIASQKSFAELTPRERTPLFISGGVSVLCWLGALVCGFLLGD